MACKNAAGGDAQKRARHGAVLYARLLEHVDALLQTAKANDLDTYAWLRRVMRDLTAAKTVEEMEALLPWNLHAQDLISETIS